MIISDEDAIKHFGIERKSGRYPWGSGETPYERAGSFMGAVKELRDTGMKDVDIARGFGMNTTQLRETTSLAKAARIAGDIAMVQRLKYEKGWSNVAIGKRMGIPDTTVGNYLRASEKRRENVLKATAEILRHQVGTDTYLDVGRGVERHMNISYEKLKTSVALLEEEGYAVHNIPVSQLGTGHQTTVKVLAPPGTEWATVKNNADRIKFGMGVYSDDGGETYTKFKAPLTISSKRVAVRYAEQGGTEADGVIYVRPGVKDVSLGKAHYAQVRISVDGTHYLKGMAMYRDDLPAGVDLMFNTNKSDTGKKTDAMKPVKKDPDDPFGASIARQIFEIDSSGKKKVSSVMNIVNAEGDWDKWSKSLSSQMLSKQPLALAKEQLGKTREAKKDELATILSVPNPVVRRHLLEKYAESTDAAAVHLKAAAMRGQGSYVILPVNSLKPTEIYAPSFENGTRVALVRYPHGGIFEIPELVVNNRHQEAKKLLGSAPDAVGIHSKVAERLSGADFDGDTVLVIPNNHGKIKSSPPLEGLKNFDPQRAYPYYEGMKVLTPAGKGQKMGDVSNLITDMHIRGANESEIARAVRHSMVVIDAEKHKLNYQQSAIDNGITALKRKYQGVGAGGQVKGASTIVSRSTAEVRVGERKLRSKKDGGPIDPETGKLVYTYSGDKYTKTTTSKTGKVKTEEIAKTQSSKQLAETDDAHTLSSGKPIEKVYADHSNELKSLANQARKAVLDIKNPDWVPSAKTKYKREVDQLEAQLDLVYRGAPLERQAQIMANHTVAMKIKANADLDDSEIKKLEYRSMEDARARLGVEAHKVEITPRQWEAIEAGAISAHKLKQILEKSDIEKVKELATPREKAVMTSAMVNRAMLMLRGDKYSLDEIAKQLGVSVSTLKRGIKGDEE